MRSLKRLLFILLYFFAPIPLAYAVYSTEPGRYAHSRDLIAMLASTAAFTWLTLQFVLSARPRFAEKHFGMDRIYRLHSYMAVIAVLLVLVHRTILEPMWEGSLNERSGNIAWFVFIAVIVSALVFLGDTPVSRLKPIARFKKALGKGWVAGYQTHLTVHYLAVAGYVAMLLHVLMSGAYQEGGAARFVLLAYWWLGAASYLYHKLIRRIILEKRAFVVDSILNEGAGMWTVSLKPKDSRQEPALTYKPGQFGFLRIFGDGIRGESHPFSLSSTPTDALGISLTIKELGDYTSGMGRVRPGMKTLFDGPYGTFSYLDHPEDDVICLIAGGVGITPALSMLRYMAEADSDRHAALFWGVNTPAELVWLEELKDYQERMPNLLLVPVVWKGEEWEGETGFVDAEKLRRHLAPYLNSPRSDHDRIGFYVCGPSPMLKSVLKSLKELGVPEGKIRYEKFSL